jgi:DNA helicase-2/ATP-dependent DNA helicase PcrA
VKSPEEILASLNPMQREAAQAIRGAVLVIAGAGSGKTRALTYRIAYMISQGIPSEKILAVTFTNKAAGEMKLRVTKLLEEIGLKGNPPLVSTFHSLCVRILRKEIHHLGRENNFVIYDDTDQLIVMKQILKELHIEEKEFNPRAILSAISSAKSQMITPENYSANSNFGENVLAIYPRYEKKLAENNGLDFDDLLLKVVELFEKFPEILDRYQEKWHFLSVDEYQDTNLAQARITNLLAEKYRNLCVIGDPDQSIYSWRGADYRNILDFKKRYPEALEIKLEQNYRSSGNILEAANAVIARNFNREEKKLWTEAEAGEKIFLMELSSERDEAEFIAREIERRVREDNLFYRDFVVLYRTNAQSRVIEEMLLRHGLPHRIIGGVKFYARKEIKDVLSYLRLIQNPRDDVALIRILNIPSRKIGLKTVEALQEYAAQTTGGLWGSLLAVDTLELPDSKKVVLKDFVRLLEGLREANKVERVSSLIKIVVSRTKLRDWWKMEGEEEGEIRYENALELISVASKYNELEPGVSLATFLEEVALLSDADQIKDNENSITLMSLHSAKGLEFPVVFIVGMEQNIFPHSRVLLDNRQLEEERRLFYVGITRAKQQLFLLRANQRMFFGETQMNAQSEFLKDLPKHLLAEDSQREIRRRGYGNIPLPDENEENNVFAPAENWQVGDTASHPVFGEGKVVNVIGGIIEIRFPVGVKKLALSIAPLTKI